MHITLSVTPCGLPASRSKPTQRQRHKHTHVDDVIACTHTINTNTHTTWHDISPLAAGAPRVGHLPPGRQQYKDKDFPLRTCAERYCRLRLNVGLCRNVTAVRLFSADQLDFASVNLCT